MRWAAKWWIDELIPDEALLDLAEKIVELLVEIDFKFIKAWEQRKKKYNSKLAGLYCTVIRD